MFEIVIQNHEFVHEYILYDKMFLSWIRMYSYISENGFSAPLWGVIMTISFCYFYVADIPRWECHFQKSNVFNDHGRTYIQSVAVVWYSHIWYNSNQYAQGYLVSWINLQFSPRAVKAIHLFKTELKYSSSSRYEYIFFVLTCKLGL